MIRGKFNTELKAGSYFVFADLDWRIYKIVDNKTFTAWEDSGLVESLVTFTVDPETLEISREVPIGNGLVNV